MVIKSAVVNGALGSIGLALVDCLVNRGIEVWAIVYPGDKRISMINSKAHVIECDMNQIEKIISNINMEIDAFFHLAWAGTIGPGRNDMFLQTNNINAAIKASNTANALKCKVFVGVGSQAECGRVEGLIKSDTPCFPTTGYGMAKLCAGQMTRMICYNSNIRHVWARVLSVYGPNDSPLSVTSIIINKLLKGEKPSLTAGEQLWDYLYVDDAAEGLYSMAVSGKEGAIYPLGSGEAKPLREYFEIIRDAINPRLELGFGEIPYPENQVMHLQADIHNLFDDTGFYPKTTFEKGIDLCIKQLMSRNIAYDGISF